MIKKITSLLAALMIAAVSYGHCGSCGTGQEKSDCATKEHCDTKKEECAEKKACDSKKDCSDKKECDESEQA